MYVTAKSNLDSRLRIPPKGFLHETWAGGRILSFVFSTKSVIVASDMVVVFYGLGWALFVRPPSMMVLKSPTSIHGSCSELSDRVSVSYIRFCISGLSAVAWYTFTMLIVLSDSVQERETRQMFYRFTTGMVISWVNYSVLWVTKLRSTR